MAKTNFRKVEEILDDGLKRMSINKLLELTEKESPKKSSSKPKDRGPSFRNGVNSLLRSLKVLEDKDPRIYEKMGIDEKDAKSLLKVVGKPSKEQILLFKEIKDKVEYFKKKLFTKDDESFDEQIIELERKKHINKRFNVNEKWIPLH